MIPAVSAALAHLGRAAGSPTADLYFRWAAAQVIGEGRIRQIAPTVFLAGRALIVFRHASQRREWPKHDRLIYVIDDDWRAGFRDSAVPLDYAAKLAFFEAWAAQWIEARADSIVVSSPALHRRYTARYPEKDIALVEPFWPAGSSAQISEVAGPPVIAMLGARSHAKDIPILFPAIHAVLAANEAVRLIISNEMPLPRTLNGHPRIELIPAMSWRDYLDWMVGRTFRVGLYPLRDTAFNRARSINKLLEYDQFGAAVIASDCWEAARPAMRDGRCVLLGSDWRVWAHEILRMLKDPGEAWAMARRNRAAISSGDHSARQAALWSRLLE